MTNVLLSIHPDQAELILSKRKRWEFRRRRPGFASGAAIWLYATKPVGVFRSGRIQEVNVERPQAALVRAGSATTTSLGEPASNRRPDLKVCIADDSLEGCTQERRALCVELGMAEQQVRNLIYISPEHVPEGMELVAWQNFLDVKEMHDQSGCRGRGRNYKDVRPVLAMLKKRGHLTWALDLWIISSSVVHQLLPERYGSMATGIELVGGPASNENRYKLADWIASVYANITDAVLSILAPAQKQAFIEMVQRVNERRPALVRDSS